MGVKGLYKIPECQDAKQILPLSHFKDMTLAADLNGQMHHFLYGIPNDRRSLFLYRVIDWIKKMILHNIEPVFVIDGKPFEYKKKEQEKRGEGKKRNVELLEIYENTLSTKRQCLSSLQLQMTIAPEEEEEKKDKKEQVLIENPLLYIDLNVNIEGEVNVQIYPFEEYEQRTHQLRQEIITSSYKTEQTRKYVEVNPTFQDFAQVKALLQFLNVTLIQAPTEGDFTLANLFHSKQVDFVYTDDSDLLCYGCTVMRISNMTFEDNEEHVEFFNIESVLASFGFNQDQFKQYCFILGNDYRESGLNGLGPKKATALMQKCKSLKKIIEEEGRTTREAIATLEKKKCMTERTTAEKEKKLQEKRDYLIHLEEFFTYYEEIKDKIIDNNQYIIKRKIKKIRKMLFESSDKINEFLSQYIKPEHLLHIPKSCSMEEEEENGNHIMLAA